MARWDVSGVSTATSASTHNLGVQPKSALSIAGPGGPNTSLAGVAALHVGQTTSTGAGARFLQYRADFSGTSANAASLLTSGPERFLLNPGAVVSTGADVSSWGTTSLSITTGQTYGNGYVVLGGDDLSVASVLAAISTVALSTQASTGYGFQPNAAIVLGQSNVSSVANFSFGFACQTTAGTIKQWSISQTARAGAGAAAYRSASTVHCMKLHTSATTAHAVRVSSVLADGLELTVDNTDTARAATISILGLKVPRVDAGRTSVTTNGVGAGVTGINVTGLGQNVGMVLIASIWSSLQTLIPSNSFSIGFASSNGNQRAVSGYVQTTEETGGGSMGTSRYCSYFSSTSAAVKTSASNVSGPLVDSLGLFAVTTDGFSLTFDNVNAAGADIYWAALSNVVTDIEAHINTSGAISANAPEVTRLAAQILSSAAFNANTSEVTRLAAAIQSSATVQAEMLPDFVPGEGKLHHDFSVITELSQDASIGLGRGQTEEAHDRYRVVTENSSSPDLERLYNITTERVRLGIAEFGNAAHLTVLPPSTNAIPMRLAAGRSGDGMKLNAKGMNTFTLADRAGSDVYLYTTQPGSTIHDVRVLIR